MPFEENQLQQITLLCQSHRVKELYVFGSALTNAFRADSDVDLLIQFQSTGYVGYFDNYMSLKESLEKVLNRAVDLVENQAVKNPIFRRVLDKEKKLLYVC